MILQKLYDIADENGVPIIDTKMHVSAMSVMDNDFDCLIAIDHEQLLNMTDEKVKLAHELGHCMRGAFYNRHSKLDIRSRHEYRADKWAIQQLIDIEDLKQANLNGITEAWELAEYFDVTQEFMQKAIDFYINQELARR